MPRLTRGVLLLAGTCAVVASLEAGGQRLRESAGIHARDYPGLPLLQVGPAGTYLPKTIEELTREAEIVIHARLALRDGNIVFKDANEVALPDVVAQIEVAARFR